VNPESSDADESETPRAPYVEWGVSLDDVASSFPIFIAHQEFTEENGSGQPTETAFDRLIFTLGSVPSLDVQVSFSVSNRSESEPE
jgi:hypothetical protein